MATIVLVQIITWLACICSATADISLQPQLFRITSDLKLTGPSGTVDLNLITGPPREIVPNTKHVALLNGVPTPERPRALLREGGGFVVAYDPDGRVLHVKGNGLSLHPIHVTESPGVFVNRAPSGDSRIVFGNDSLQAPQEDGSPFGTAKAHHAGSRISCHGARSPPRDFVIAVAGDYKLCEIYGGFAHTAMAIDILFDLAEAAFSSFSCIRLVPLVAINCNRDTDPFRSLSSYDGANILTEFKSIWHGGPLDLIDRDATIFFSGFDDGTESLGLAWVGEICSLEYGYGWVEHLDEYVLVHQLGHLLGASHAERGIMRNVIRRGQLIWFNEESVNQIVSHVDAISDSNCLKRTLFSPSPSPTAFPSEAYVPHLTPPPSSSPSPTASVSPAPAGPTCEGLFTNERSMKCVNRNASEIIGSFNIISGAADGQTVSVPLKMYQRFGFALEISAPRAVIEGTGDARIVRRYSIDSINTTISFNNGLVRSDMTDANRPKLGHRRMLFLISADRVEVNSGISTCCGETVSVYVSLSMTERVVRAVVPRWRRYSLSAFQRFEYTTRCDENLCETPSRLRAMSATRNCPRCAAVRG